MSTLSEFVDLMLPAINATPTNAERQALLQSLLERGYTETVHPRQHAGLIDLIYVLLGRVTTPPGESID
jgi:hypothetical protein